MARAHANVQSQDYRSDPGDDWLSLRSELVALLDQVEGQVSRRRGENLYDSVAERMHDIRHQLTEPDTDRRHREALQSVKRAVERFTDRYDEPGPYGTVGPANPRDTLQSAVREIRARQAELADHRMAAGERAAQTAALSPRFDELTRSFGGISTRLERLETELRGASKIQTGNVKEIAEQVAQLSHVVELLAGAVGETGQVKRLESQIAALGKLVAQGPQVDLSALTQRLDSVGSVVNRLLEQDQKAQAEGGVFRRLDDVSETIGRLADLQVEFANRVDVSAQTSAGFKDSLRSVEGAMHAIEDGVRNIYDRIDAIEKSEALPSSALDRVTEELARVTETLGQPIDSEGMAKLLQLVEALNNRINALESPHADVGELKLDMHALRATVSEAVEPRFAAIEMQLEALNERVATAPAPDISVSQLESQVRQLVARMDQTGEQLTGLARLYSQPADRGDSPDFEALAEMVAARTSEAVALNATGSRPTALSGSDIDEIERRVSRLVGSVRNERTGDDLAGIESSIRAVNERLARLETSLDRPAEPVDAAEMHVAEPTVVAPPPDPIARLLNEAADAAVNDAQGKPGRRDAMPANPAADAPLRDRPFGPDTHAVRAALEAKNGPRRPHPGLSADASGAAAVERALSPGFDPASAQRPPRPASSLEDAVAPVKPAADSLPHREGEDPVSANTNTFIAAARRAAMRQQPAAPSASSNSVIAKAFASIQARKAEETKTPAAVEASEPPVAEPTKKRGRLGRLLAGDKEPRTKWGAKVEAADVSAPMPPTVEESGDAPPEMQVADDDLAPRESFLSRHRRPILLAASLIAIAFLTLNLINQRLSQGAVDAEPPAPEETVETSSIEAEPSPLSKEPIATAASAVGGPRVIPIVDSLSTASIDPSAAKGFTPTQELPPATNAFVAAAAEMPDAAIEAVAAVEADTPAPVVHDFESPVHVDLPPAELGPEALREAAANGDARAQFEIAAIYTEGRAVSEDLVAAAVWYERSAAQGFAPAQYRLGNLYENGRGVEKDMQQARLWYQRAAEAGNRMAMHNLAALYAGGQLGEQQFDAAAEWFEQAARRGMRDSQFNLGMLYARGLGVEQDLEASFRWFSLAALRGDPDAGKARDDVARSLNAETVSRLQEEIDAFVLADIDLAANYAPIGTWSAGFDPGESIGNQEVVKSVQAALGALGFEVGAPDGLMGPNTADAIRAFERATGMSESGKVNPRLLAVLGSQPV